MIIGYRVIQTSSKLTGPATRHTSSIVISTGSFRKYFKILNSILILPTTPDLTSTGRPQFRKIFFLSGTFSSSSSPETIKPTTNDNLNEDNLLKPNLLQRSSCHHHIPLLRASDNCWEFRFST